MGGSDIWDFDFLSNRITPSNAGITGSKDGVVNATAFGIVERLASKPIVPPAGLSRTAVGAEVA